MFRSQFALLLASRALGSATQAICMVFLARWTDPATFGRVSVVIAVGIVLVAVADLGLGTYVLRARVVAGQRESIPSALRLNMFSSVVLGTVGLVILCFLARVDPIYISLVPIAVWLTAEKNADIWLNISIADGKSSHAALAITARRGSALAIFFVMCALGSNAILSYSLSVALGSIVGLFVSRRLVRIEKGGPLAYGSIIAASWPYWVSNMTSQIRNADVLVVSSIAGPASAGLYAAAVRLTNPILLFTGSLTSVLLPSVSQSDLETIRRCNRLFALSGVLAIAGMLATAWPLSALGAALLGDDFAEARPAIAAMLVSTVFIGLCPASASIIQGLGDSKFSAKNGIYFVPIICLGVAAGSMFAGALGAAIAIGSVFALKFLFLQARIALLMKQRSAQFANVNQCSYEVDSESAS